MGKISNAIKDARRKKCAKCKATKAADQFYANAHYKDRRDSYCKACRAASAEAWRKANPGGWAERMRRHRAKKAGRQLCGLCGHYSLKAAGLSARESAIAAYAETLGDDGLPLPDAWCVKCGAEHAPGPCARKYAPGYAACAVAECGAAALKGEARGRCRQCAAANKSVPRRMGAPDPASFGSAALARKLAGNICTYCKGNGWAANGTDSGEACSGCYGTGRVHDDIEEVVE